MDLPYTWGLTSGESFQDPISADGTLRNMVVYDDYVQSTVAPRHINRKKRAEVLLQLKSDYPEYVMHPVIKSCLTMNWYMYGSIFDGCGGESPQTVSKVQVIEI